MNDFFGKFPSFGIGFENVFRDLENMAKTATKSISYPPYNIRKDGENKYVIELAVAGFSEQDLVIELEKGNLIIRGEVSQDTAANDEYLYKGIAQRPFERKFVLKDTIEVKNAEIVNGMLRIWLEQMVELSNIKRIPIASEQPKTAKKVA